MESLSQRRVLGKVTLTSVYGEGSSLEIVDRARRAAATPVCVVDDDLGT